MGTTSQVGKKKKMSVHTIDTVASMKKLKEKIRYVEKNIHIGTSIKIKVFGGAKKDYRILKLERIEGVHYIFVSKHGWIEAYTMNQLCFEVSNGNIKIIKEDKNDG